MEDNKTKLFKALTVFTILGTVLVGAMVISEVKGYRFIGEEFLQPIRFQ